MWGGGDSPCSSVTPMWRLVFFMGRCPRRSYLCTGGNSVFCTIDWRFGTDMKLPCINCTVYSPHLSRTLLLLLEHFTLLHSNLVSSSWLLFSYSCHFFYLQLSSFSQQKHFSSAILITSHNVTIDKNWSLTFVRFLVCFVLLLLLLLFSLIFSNVKYFLL